MYDLLECAFMLKTMSCTYYTLFITHKWSCRVSQSSFSLPMIVHRSQSCRRSSMQTIHYPQTSGHIWTCCVKYSRYEQNVMILHNLLLTTSMQHPAMAQQQFSSESVPTIPHIFPMIEFLLTSLEAAEKDKTFTPICGAITAGISNLSKWYWRLDQCHVYALCNSTSNLLTQSSFDWSTTWQFWICPTS